jgi:hypothetical protein
MPSIASPDSFSLFAIVKNLCVYQFNKFGKWTDLSDVPGTLTLSCDENKENGLTTYDISGEFRVKNATAKNSTLLALIGERKAIIKYKSGTGEIRIAGTKKYPLTFTVSEPSDFEGYVCRFTGKQNTPLAFINAD